MRNGKMTIIVGLFAALSAAPILANAKTNFLCDPNSGAFGGIERVRPGRPDAFTRGILPTAIPGSADQAAPRQYLPLRPGRPEANTRGILPESSLKVTASNAAPAMPEPWLKFGRPEGYTRGIQPGAWQDIVCPVMPKPPLS